MTIMNRLSAFVVDNGSLISKPMHSLRPFPFISCVTHGWEKSIKKIPYIWIHEIVAIQMTLVLYLIHLYLLEKLFILAHCGILILTVSVPGRTTWSFLYGGIGCPFVSLLSIFGASCTCILKITIIHCRRIKESAVLFLIFCFGMWADADGRCLYLSAHMWKIQDWRCSANPY